MIRKVTFLKRGFSTKPLVPLLDSNDTLNSLELIRPKIAENLSQGTHTYGFSEYLLFCDDLIQSSWLSLASSMGMGKGLIALTLMTRLVYLPLGLYSQTNMQKMKKIKP